MSDPSHGEEGVGNIAAEFHDIGKLIDWRYLEFHGRQENGTWESAPHDFEKCTDPEWGIDRSVAHWQTIWRKDNLRKNYWPGSLTWVWAQLGDMISAGWGRPFRELKGTPRYGRYCLWTGESASDSRLRSYGDLQNMIAFVNTSPSWAEAVKNYSALWRARAEAAHPGVNVTSLLSHSVVAGKLARVLASLPQHPFRPDMVWSDVDRLLDKPKVTVAHYKVEMYQRPFRVSDWNIFSQRRAALDSAVERFADNVLARVANECVAVFTSDEQSDQFASLISSAGFAVRRKQIAIALSTALKPGIRAAMQKAEDWQYSYSESLPQRIDLHICECCQMARAHRNWPRDYLAERPDLGDEARQWLRETEWRELAPELFPETDRPKVERWLGEPNEDLCDRCFELRRNAEPLRKLASWAEGSVAWLYYHLDLDCLADTLARLHREYLLSCNPSLDPRRVADLQVCYPLMVDFLDDYEVFLGAFGQGIEHELSRPEVEQVEENLWCVRLEERRHALELLRLHAELMQSRFPKLLNGSMDSPCPIRLAVSISPIKHPFFAHWRFLEKPAADVAVQLVGSGVANLALHHLQDVLQALDHGKRGALHRLRDIARTSESLAHVVFDDKEDRDKETFQKLRAVVPGKLDFQSLLTLTNLAED